MECEMITLSKLGIKERNDLLLVLPHYLEAVTKGPAGTMEVLAGCSRESKAGGPGASYWLSVYTYPNQVPRGISNACL